MTLRLYYQDSYLKDFRATVVERRQGGDGVAVVLDQTAFYPASGGQPCDTGVLGGAKVLNVEEDSSGAILHFLNSDIPGGSVEGHIDWERRFDHMQQHTGQHILSQAFLKLARAQTLSFHLGQEISTIDLEMETASPALILEVEQLCARIVFEDRPVHIMTVGRQDLEALGARKESGREGPIRVIDVQGFDRSPCGGTHVRHTGEIGLVAVLGSERYKGGIRAEFVCGLRAVETFRKEHQILQQIARLYTSHPNDLPQLAERLFHERTSLVRENARLQDQVLEMEAEELRNDADKIGGIMLIRKTFADRKVESVKALAQKLITRQEVVAILAIGGASPQVVIARSENVPGSCSAAVKEAAAKVGGKGGGRPALAQAGGMAASALEEWLRVVEAYFRAGLQG
jgi:alanyl-tRNA synthetase